MRSACRAMTAFASRIARPSSAVRSRHSLAFRPRLLWLPRCRLMRLCSGVVRSPRHLSGLPQMAGISDSTSRADAAASAARPQNRRRLSASPDPRRGGNTDHITHRQQLPIFSTLSSVLPLRAAEDVSHPMPRRVLDDVCCPTAAIGALTACTFKRVISLISPYSIIIRVEQRWRDTPIPRPLTFLSTSSGAAVVAGLADSAVSR